jgi:hypothetical protein
MISTWPPPIGTQEIKAGSALFHVQGLRQHAGIAAEPAKAEGAVKVYTATENLCEYWNTEPEHKRRTRWRIRVAGWIEHADIPEVRGEVLRQCNRLESLTYGRPAERSCCWQIRDPYRLVEDEDVEAVVFTGSCAGFVEYCYEKAGVDLVDEAQLPETQLMEGEPSYIREEYDNAPENRIKRLYPSYQIRAFQEEIYPWTPDPDFRFYPTNFDR